jgi:hypothetical protein
MKRALLVLALTSALIIGAIDTTPVALLARVSG